MEARSQFAVKLLPSLADFAFLMPIAFLFGRMDGVRTLLSDCDTGWHIRTGEWIIANGWVPMRDIFSFSKPGSPWFAWEWLSDVLFARLNGMGGLQAVVMFTVVMLSVTFGALFLLVRRKSNPIVAIAVTVLAAAGSSIHWLARPHLFTLLFLVLFYAALEQVKEGRTHLMGVPILGALPVATILWTNLHGGFFVGALMILAYGGGEMLQLVFSPDAENRGPRMAQGAQLFSQRPGVPGRQPDQSVHVPPARTHGAIPQRSVELRAHHGILLAEFPPPDRDLLRSDAGDGGGGRDLEPAAGPIHGGAADIRVVAWRSAGRAQHSDLHDRRRAAGGRRHSTVPAARAGSERGRLVSGRGRRSSTGWPTRPPKPIRSAACTW